MRSTLPRRLLLTIGAAFALACGDSGTGPSSVEGTYSLSTINGKGLPYTITETFGSDVYTTTFISPFTLTLGTNSSVRIIVTVRSTFNGLTETVTDTTTGTYTQNGNNVNITTDGDTVPAAWNGSDQLTITSDGDVLIFRK